VADARREYVATFSIGAKLLGTFRGSLNAAQARLSALQRSVTRSAASIRSALGAIGLSFGTLATMFGGFLAANILGKLFGSATEEAIEANKRTRDLTATLTNYAKKYKKSTAGIAEQIALIREQNDALEKQGVLSSDIFDIFAVSLSAQGYSTKRILESSKALGDLLAKWKGVGATEEDALSLMNAIRQATLGKGRQLARMFPSITLDDLARIKKLKGQPEAILKEVIRLAAKYKDFNKTLRDTPEGRIKSFQNALRNMSEEIGRVLLPLQADMADAWREALPEIVPAFIAGIKALGRALKWTGIEAKNFMKQFTSKEGQDTMANLSTSWDNVTAAINAFSGATDQAHVKSESFGEYMAKQFRAMLQTDAEDLQRFADQLNRWHAEWQRDWTATKLAMDKFWIGLKIGAEIAFKWLVKVAEKIRDLATSVKGAWWTKLPGVAQAMSAGGAATAVGGAIGRAVGGRGGAAAAGAPGIAPPQAALSPEARASIVAEREAFIKELQTPAMTKLLAGTLAAEASTVEDRKNVLEALVNRAAAHKVAGTYKGMESEITGGFYGPVNRGEVAASLRAGIPPALIKETADALKDVGAGRSALRGMTDQGMVNEIKGYKEKVGEDWYGMMQGLPSQYQTAAYKGPLSLQAGGIVTKPSLATLGERGPEMVIPLNRGGGMTTTVSFAPNIVINGNASEMEQRAMDSRLRDLARDFINQFKAAQRQERRLSYESGYA
jgi:hypothetical protein